MIFSLLKVDFREPEIRELTEAISFVGFSIDTSDKSIGRDIGTLGKKFKKLKETYSIPNVKVPREFVAVTKDYDPVKGSMEYQMGDIVVGEPKELHEELSLFEVPVGKYAVFTIEPKARFLWGYTMIRMKLYIYKKWLPASPYTNAGTIDDFEHHDERSLGKKPLIELYVAIK